MNSLTENFPSPIRSVGCEGGGIPGGAAALNTRILDPNVEFMRYCEHCGEERQFICAWFSLVGLIGRCLYCGTPDVAPYTRTNSEAA